MTYQLSLTEYAAKYGVSVSTLRRKIKKKEVSFIQENGKYLLPDVSYSDLKNRVSIASPQEVLTQKVIVASPQKRNDAQQKMDGLGLDLDFTEDQGEDLAPLKDLAEERAVAIQADSSAGFISELKNMYKQMLGEKEQQIMVLKSHIADLQTLNKALEGEIERLESEQKKTSVEFDDFADLDTTFIEHEF